MYNFPDKNSLLGIAECGRSELAIQQFQDECEGNFLSLRPQVDISMRLFPPFKAEIFLIVTRITEVNAYVFDPLVSGFKSKHSNSYFVPSLFIGCGGWGKVDKNCSDWFNKLV